MNLVKKLGRYYIVGLVLVAVFGATGFFAFNQAPVAVAQQLSPDQKAKLQAEYDQLQVEIAQWQKILDDTKVKKKSLTGDVSTLTAKINKAQAEINQRNVVISQLQSQIAEKAKTVASLEQQLADGKASLAKLLRSKNEVDNTSLAIVMLGSGSLSDFFNAVSTIDTLNKDLQEHFDKLRGIEMQTQKEKDALAAQQNAQLDARHAVQTTQKKITIDKQQKNQLLAITTNQETEYQKVLAANQAKAAAIRAALFPLRDASAIKFGDALAYAQAAQKKTGVDPALILAVLTQESNLGTNVGQCYLTSDTTGAGVGKNTGKAFANVMKPSRDVPPFLSLASRLGFDPHKQVVSCPIPSAGGYGGAMGPAQFIPSTWAMYELRIARALGVSTPNPWAAQDAIMAMSLYFEDLGADAGSYSAKRTAAAKYYAGGAWATAGQSYGTQVMAKVADIQQNIDFLTNN